MKILKRIKQTIIINSYAINNRGILQQMVGLLLVSLLFQSCASIKHFNKVVVQPHPTFVSAGKPLENRATLFIPNTAAIKVNGVIMPGRIFGGRWCMWELLPGEYQIEYYFRLREFSGHEDLSGKFTAVNGRSYALIDYRSRQKWGANSSLITYHGSYIVELPDDFDDSGIHGVEVPEKLHTLKRIVRLR